MLESIEVSLYFATVTLLSEQAASGRSIKTDIRIQMIFFLSLIFRVILSVLNAAAVAKQPPTNVLYNKTTVLSINFYVLFIELLSDLYALIAVSAISAEFSPKFVFTEKYGLPAVDIMTLPFTSGSAANSTQRLMSISVG